VNVKVPREESRRFGKVIRTRRPGARARRTGGGRRGRGGSTEHSARSSVPCTTPSSHCAVAVADAVRLTALARLIARIRRIVVRRCLVLCIRACVLTHAHYTRVFIRNTCVSHWWICSHGRTDGRESLATLRECKQRILHRVGYHVRHGRDRRP